MYTKILKLCQLRHFDVEKEFEDYERESYQKLVADIESQDDRALQISILALLDSHFLLHSPILLLLT